jgi:hypothetical protein
MEKQVLVDIIKELQKELISVDKTDWELCHEYIQKCEKHDEGINKAINILWKYYYQSEDEFGGLYKSISNYISK